jgi:hypothetical protein
MAAGATVFRDTLISVIPAVSVASPTLSCRRRRSHPWQAYIRDSSGSSCTVAEMTLQQTTDSSVTASYPLFRRMLPPRRRYYVQPGHPPQRYIPHSSFCFCDLQEITPLQNTVARSNSKCVALSVMRTICWDVNGIRVYTIRNLKRREGSD